MFDFDIKILKDDKLLSNELSLAKYINIRVDE